MSSGVSVQGVYVLGGMCPGVYVLGGMCPGGTCPGGTCLRAICPWGKCPGVHVQGVLSCSLKVIPHAVTQTMHGIMLYAGVEIWYGLLGCDIPCTMSTALCTCELIINSPRHMQLSDLLSIFTCDKQLPVFKSVNLTECTSNVQVFPHVRLRQAILYKLFILNVMLELYIQNWKA